MLNMIPLTKTLLVECLNAPLLRVEAYFLRPDLGASLGWLATAVDRDRLRGAS